MQSESSTRKHATISYSCINFLIVFFTEYGKQKNHANTHTL